jgi:hypothetical protein
MSVFAGGACPTAKDGTSKIKAAKQNHKRPRVMLIASPSNGIAMIVAVLRAFAPLNLLMDSGRLAKSDPDDSSLSRVHPLFRRCKLVHPPPWLLNGTIEAGSQRRDNVAQLLAQGDCVRKFASWVPAKHRMGQPVSAVLCGRRGARKFLRGPGDGPNAGGGGNGVGDGFYGGHSRIRTYDFQRVNPTANRWLFNNLQDPGGSLSSCKHMQA